MVSSPLPGKGLSLSAEARVVLCTAGGADTDESIRTLVPQITNWQRLLELSVGEGAQPVLGRRLRQAAAGALPDGVVDALEHVERVATFRQRYLRERLMAALDLLSAAGIPVILLKGAALAHATYRSFVDRPMSDIDLLVTPERAPETQAMLSGAGWTRRYDREFDEWYSSMHHLPPLVDARATSLAIGLEVHTELIPANRNPFAFFASEIRKSAIPAEGLAHGTFVPTAVQRLLHCCLHFAWSNRLNRGAWRTFSDVNAILREDRFPWGDFIDTARDSRGMASCYWTLRLARTLTHAPVPDHVLEQLDPGLPRWVLPLCERHFGHGVIDSERVCPSVRLQEAVWATALEPRSANVRPRRAWDGEDRPWHLMRQHAGLGGAGHPGRRVTSPGAWLRYLGSIASGRAAGRREA